LQYLITPTRMPCHQNTAVHIYINKLHQITIEGIAPSKTIHTIYTTAISTKLLVSQYMYMLLKTQNRKLQLSHRAAPYRYKMLSSVNYTVPKCAIHFHYTNPASRYLREYIDIRTYRHAGGKNLIGR
jgi:hypothetical protein